MNGAVVTLISLSLSGSLLALALLALKPLLKNIVSKAFSYYIWAIVLIRLVLPIGAPVNAMEALFGNAFPPAAAQSVMGAGSGVQPETGNSPGEEFADINSGELPPSAPQTQDDADVSGQTARPPQDAFGLWAFAKSNLLWIWAAGALISFAWFVIAYLRFYRQIKRTNARPLPADFHVFHALRGNRRVNLACNSFITTPMLVGVFSPAIVIPRLAYVRNGMETELENILLHELTHQRRKDLVYKWLAVAVTSLHWFNPLMILIRREIARACELSCDEAVIRNMTDDEKQRYGDTLLTLSASRRLPAGLLATTLCEKKSELKERLISIMKYRKTTAWMIALSLALALALAGCATALGAATGRGNAENQVTANAPSGDIKAAPTPSAPATQEPGIVDFDADGLADTVKTEQMNSGRDNAYVVMAVTLGSGREQHEVSLGGEMGENKPTLCDLNGDGRDDILLCLKDPMSEYGAVYPYLSRVEDGALSPKGYPGDFIKNNAIAYPQPENFIGEKLRCVSVSVLEADGKNLLRFRSLINTEAKKDEATAYYIDASWNGKGWYIENVSIGKAYGGDKIIEQGQPVESANTVTMLPTQHREGFAEAEITLVEPVAAPAATRDAEADYDPAIVKNPGPLSKEVAQQALRQLYDMTGVQVKKCYATGDASHVLLSLDGKDFNLESFCTASFGADGHCRSLTIAYKQEGVDYSPIDPANVVKPDGFSSMSDAKIARWYYENSSFGDRRAVVSEKADSPYAGIVSLILGDGDYYEVSFDDASGLSNYFVGPISPED